jgi:hypothetical protein
MNNYKKIKELILLHGRIPIEHQQDFTVLDIIHFLNSEMIYKGKTDCPVCRAHHQTYKRTISKTLVYWLTVLKKLSKDGKKSVHFKDVDNYLYDRLKLNGSDYIILKHWNLIIPDLEVDEKSGKEVYTGKYSITSDGLRFLDGSLRVNKYLYFANGRVIKKSPELIGYIDPKNFDINDLTKL